MQVIIGDKVLEADILDVVRLVASARGILDVDVDPGPTKTVIKYGGNSCSGKTRDLACAEFLRRVLT